MVALLDSDATNQLQMHNVEAQNALDQLEMHTLAAEDVLDQLKMHTLSLWQLKIQ